jgi:hypothetical protein
MGGGLFRLRNVIILGYFYYLILPSKARTVFARSNTEIVVSNPT